MHSRFRTFMLIAILTALLLFVGQLIGGMSGLLIAGVFAVLFNFGSWYFSDRIVLAIYRAKPASDSHPLVKHVRHVAQLANMPIPKVYIIPSASPNAFATGRSPKHSAVAATQGIVDLLTPSELEGVIAHELAHIKNRDTLIQTIASTIAGVIGFIASMSRWAAIFGGFGGRDNDGGGNIIQLLVLAIVTPIAALLLQMAISRSREYLADETGANFTKNPYALASALEKLDGGIKHTPLTFGSNETASLFIANPFRMTGVVKLLSTHPPMEERISRLRKMTI